METQYILTYQEVRKKLVEFILANFLFGDSEKVPDDEDSLLQTGVVDSTGILELIEFLETEFNFQVLDNETVPENLDGIANVVRYVLRKSSDRGAAIRR